MTRTYQIHHAVGPHITRSIRTRLESVYNQNLRLSKMNRLSLRRLVRKLGLPRSSLHDESHRLDKTLSIFPLTTDNGSEFLDPEAIEALSRHHGTLRVSTPTPMPSGEKVPRKRQAPRPPLVPPRH